MAQSISILTPILYVAVLLTSLIVFSTVYRRRKLSDITKTEPWYTQNFPRELYFSLKDNPTTQKVPEKLIKAALIRWAAEDVRQMLKMRENKPVLTSLHQRGSIGDDVWNRFNTSEKLLQLEINEIAQEANDIKEGWAQQLLQTATEVCQNEGLRKRLVDLTAQQTDYKEAYDNIRKSSLNELEAS